MKMTIKTPTQMKSVIIDTKNIEIVMKAFNWEEREKYPTQTF